jgi:Domain of unknown function DUF29
MTQALSTLYEADFVQWTDRTAQLLRRRQFHELDLENIIEEIEDLGRRERQALYSNLKIILIHLLKWQFQPSKRSNSWRATLREHRQRIQLQLKDSSSLKPYLSQSLDDCYANARDLATDETGLPLNSFPEICPYSVAFILDPSFLPD